MYKIIFDKKVEKQMLKLPYMVRKAIQKWYNLIQETNNPYYNAKHLKGNLGLYWRYRIGDYRLIYEVNNDVITIFVLAIGHRKEIYDKYYNK